MIVGGSAGAGQVMGTHLNVAQVLKEPVGATRRYRLRVDELPLGEDRLARGITGTVKLMRVGRGLLVTGEARASVDLTCMRCLEDYTQPVTLELEEEFRPSIDVGSGLGITYSGPDSAAEADFFLIGDDHVLDLSEALRQTIWLSVPMVPRCREDCPGIPFGEGDTSEKAPEEAPVAPAPGVDDRLAVLQRLLDGADDSGAPEPPPPARR
jgi:uncharacterized protein